MSLPSTYEVAPVGKLSLEMSATLESNMEESAKLALPAVDVNTLLSAMVSTVLRCLQRIFLSKHMEQSIIGQKQALGALPWSPDFKKRTKDHFP